MAVKLTTATALPPARAELSKCAMWCRRVLAVSSVVCRTRPTIQCVPIAAQDRSIHRWVAPTLREFYRRQAKVPEDKRTNPRNTYLEWNSEAELYAFGKRLNETFNSDLLDQAFTHRSYIVQEEMRQRTVGIEASELQLKDNRSLIEEGESFMADYITCYLTAALPKFPNAGIKAVKDHLMSTKMLANISFHLGTKDLILSDVYPPTDDLLSDTLKALVAALAYSSGNERAADFVRDFVITMLHGENVNDIWKIDNAMEMLTDLLKKSNKTPEPRLIGQMGKNTLLACYRVGIYVDKEMFCYGFGETVPIATDMAAREGLKIFFGTQENMAPINFKLSGVPIAQIRAEKSQAS